MFYLGHLTHICAYWLTIKTEIPQALVRVTVLNSFVWWLNCAISGFRVNIYLAKTQES